MDTIKSSALVVSRRSLFKLLAVALAAATGAAKVRDIKVLGWDLAKPGTDTLFIYYTQLTGPVYASGKFQDAIGEIYFVARSWGPSDAHGTIAD